MIGFLSGLIMGGGLVYYLKNNAQNTPNPCSNEQSVHNMLTDEVIEEEKTIFDDYVDDNSTEKDIIHVCHRDLVKKGKLTEYSRTRIFEYIEDN